MSHALVLPDSNFMSWYRAAEAYTRAFDRVAVVRSPAGNDLNRFRDVTAVQAPGVWINNDPVSHIRRVYPMVILIDVIRANTPQALEAALGERIARRDRYGSWLNDGHLHPRFVIGWPGEVRGAAIVRRFNTDLGGGRRNEGIDITAAAGATIRSATTGTVVNVTRAPAWLGYGDYVQVLTPFFSPATGLQEYVITYTNLQQIGARVGQKITLGDVLGKAVGPTVRVVVQLRGGGVGGYVMPNVVNPAPLIYWDLRLRPTVDGLRIRERPGTQYKIIGQVYQRDLLETLEMHGRTLEKLGDAESWLKVRTPLNMVGYTAAWLLQAAVRDSMTHIEMSGINLDFLNPLGRPAPERMRGVGWLRLPYKATPSQGFSTMEAAHAFYEPLLNRYLAAGFKLIIILTHQTWGEGAGYNFSAMYREDRGRWDDYIPRFVEAVRSVARRYAGRGFVYQIWNEQDTPFGATYSAISMLPEDYARLLTEAIRAIRAHDPSARVITGGHMSGPWSGSDYARATLRAMPADVRPDGLAAHSYGRGAPNSSAGRYAPFGPIDPDITLYERVLPGAPVWITEFGVLDLEHEPADQVGQYAFDFIRYLKANYRPRVAAAVWYAWADGMHNGYGLVDRNDRPKQPLLQMFLDA